MERYKSSMGAGKPNFDKEPVLFVSNLDKSVGEHEILKLLTKCGAVKKFDYFWHKKGPNKGEPKGCCRVEYKEMSSAENAIKNLDGKLLRKRKLRVNFSDPSLVPSSSSSSSTLGGAFTLNPCAEKSHAPVSSQETVKKIGTTLQIIEAKLLSLEKSASLENIKQ